MAESTPGGLTRPGLTGAALAAAPARAAGLPIGSRVGSGDPISVRMFRRAGTRIVCGPGVGPALLLSMRTAASGALVMVRTDRPEQWRGPLSGWAHQAIVDSRPLPEMPSRIDDPVLIVDDAPDSSPGAGGSPGSGAAAAAAPVGEVRGWQCRLSVRELAGGAELSAAATADLLIVGQLPADTAIALSAALGLGPAAAITLRELSGGRVALIRHRRISYVELVPSDVERQALARR